MIKLYDIFKTFLIIGIQLIGGGYVIFPLLKKYIVEEKKWIKEDELLDYFALSQSLPGIIALNVSIFSGYKLSKIKGAISAVLGLILPSFIIILLIPNFLIFIRQNKYLTDAFFGVRLSVIVLLSAMIYDVFEKSPKSFFSVFLFFLILFLVYFGITPTIAVILAVIISCFKGVFQKC